MIYVSWEISSKIDWNIAILLGRKISILTLFPDDFTRKKLDVGSAGTRGTETTRAVWMQWSFSLLVFNAKIFLLYTSPEGVQFVFFFWSVGHKKGFLVFLFAAKSVTCHGWRIGAVSRRCMMDGWWVAGLKTEGGNLEILHFLPWSWKSTMGPCNSSFLSNIAIFHFHDYGKKGTCYRWVRSFRTIWVDVKPRPEFLRQSQSGVLCSMRNMIPTYFGVGADNKNVLMNRKCSDWIVAYNGGWWWMMVDDCSIFIS